MDEIGAALAAFDRGALARAAHKLKGASSIIHANVLCELAYAIESQSPNLDQPRLEDLVQRLRNEFERTGEFLQRQLVTSVLAIARRR